jgi:hypothetical protein
MSNLNIKIYSCLISLLLILAETHMHSVRDLKNAISQNGTFLGSSIKSCDVGATSP